MFECKVIPLVIFFSFGEGMSLSAKVLLVDRDVFEIEKAVSVLRKNYDVITATNVQEAFELMQNENIDMIFADFKMIMPDGKSLLLKVKEKFPNVIRVILGGKEEDSVIFNAIQQNIAKTCILKPWDQNILVLANKIFETEERLKKSDLFSYIINLNELPTIRASYQKIIELIDSDSEMQDIADAIGSDPSMAAKLLRVANSTYYGVKTNSIKQAVTYLGMKNIRDLVLSTSIFDMFNTKDVPERVFQPLWQQSFTCSKIVSATYKMLGKSAPAHASLAGLLINIGSIFLLKRFDKRYMNIIQEVKQLNREKSEVTIENLEIEAFGSTHSQVGGYLLNWWEIPYTIVEAAIYHHNPFNKNVIDKELLSIVHIAEHYSAKSIYLDSSINDVEECFKYLCIEKSKFERKIDDLLLY